MSGTATQLGLFDAAAARAARDAGMAAAAGHAGPVWRVLALAALERLCRQQATVHCDDLAQEVVLTPPHPYAWGAVWHAAIKAGWLERTGEYAPSRQKGKHAHQYPRYRSLLYGRVEKGAVA